MRTVTKIYRAKLDRRLIVSFIPPLQELLSHSINKTKKKNKKKAGGKEAEAAPAPMEVQA